MPYRVYITPVVLAPYLNTGMAMQPKHIGQSSYAWEMVDYGAEQTAFVAVHDVSAADHAIWVADPEVFALPVDLTQNMTAGAVIAAQTFLEARNIPAQWINTTRTYKQVLKVTIGLFQFIQRWRGITRGSSPFKEGLDLNRSYSSLPSNTKVTLQGCFTTLNIDSSMLTGASTIREILFEFGTQFATRSIIFGGEPL